MVLSVHVWLSLVLSMPPGILRYVIKLQNRFSYLPSNLIGKWKRAFKRKTYSVYMHIDH